MRLLEAKRKFLVDYFRNHAEEMEKKQEEYEDQQFEQFKKNLDGIHWCHKGIYHLRHTDPNDLITMIVKNEVSSYDWNLCFNPPSPEKEFHVDIFTDVPYIDFILTQIKDIDNESARFFRSYVLKYQKQQVNKLGIML